MASELDRIVREQAFTVLNRLAALRMMEARGLLLESVANGYQSKGFQLYEHLAGHALGETGDAYRCYLFSLFDEFALDLKVLFDRNAPQGQLFPRESTLLELLDLLNAADIEPLWSEDETIGWIYQYFNSPEERKKMREEGKSGPRNSRELAVRNQFFTPRYVVEFLTDNTLGRIWYEMTQGQTCLRDKCRYLLKRPNEIFLQRDAAAPEQPRQNKLSQEQLLRQPVYIPHRLLKDPREICMLDPACGSMHFGLYAFDLFEAIYGEAWEIAHGSDEVKRSSASFAPFASLVVQYPDKSSFLADVPRLIIEHNLHGIDIDPRSVQIAGLCLWLRAQRTWQQQGLHPRDRPRIRRSNIVCAEPMPGEEKFLEEFTAAHLITTPERKLLGQLVHRVFDAMKLAGEAGSLLKIEEEIAGAVIEAKHKWLAIPKPEQFRLFDDNTAANVQEEHSFDVIGITNETFWERAEEGIYAALQAYAEQIEHDGYQRRLFTDDAARGFAFINLCRKHYDVVLMNPPFGAPSRESKSYVETKFKHSGKDMYSAFVTRGCGQLSPSGRLGAITSRSGLFLASFAKWRHSVLFDDAPVCLITDLGSNVLDTAMVETAAYVLEKTDQFPSLTAIRLITEELKHKPLLESLSSVMAGMSDDRVFCVEPSRLKVLPGVPLAYWVPAHVLRLFEKKSTFATAGASLQRGLFTADDFRFIRLYSEVNPCQVNFGGRWSRFVKGGDNTRFYRPVELVVLSDSEFSEIAAVVTARYPYLKGDANWVLHMENGYGNAGLTYTLRTSSPLALRVLPEGCYFANKGPAVFSNRPWLLLGLLNSQLVLRLIELFMGRAGGGARQYDIQIIERTPWPLSLSELSDVSKEIEDRVKFAVNLSRDIWLSKESECLFVRPCISSSLKQGLPEYLLAHEAWEKKSADTISQALVEIEALTEKAYGLYKGSFEDVGIASEEEFQEDEDDESEVVGISPTKAYHHLDLTAYFIGTAFGRWDIRFATDEKQVLDLPDPFAPLPVCPPGQLQNEQDLPLTKNEVLRLKKQGRWNYPIDIPWDGIMVDDPDHPLDIEARVHQVLQIIWKDGWENIDREACEILGVHTLRDYYRKPAGFFADHLKRYSKSRRQAPIYWPLATASGNYTLWIYYHRLTDQTLYTCVNNFVELRLSRLTEELSALRSATGGTHQQDKQLEQLTDFEVELREFCDELLRVARFWKPNLNDGVQIIAAPLWKLFQHKPWQKKLRETWKKLEKGDYDWAHLAMNYWPERVRVKCKTDKSLAIAHGLEELYEEPPEQSRKTRRRGKAG